jgi:hypothetical protein
MLQKHSIPHAQLKRYLWYSALAAVSLLAAGDASWAASKKVEPPVRLIDSMAVPVAVGNTTGGMYSFDISYVDQATGTYYLADRSNKAVDALAAGGSIVTQIFPNNGHAAFAGFVPCSPPAGANDCAGPNGVVAAFPWLFVTDAPSRVLSFDLRVSPPKTVGECTTMSVGGKPDPTRADELAYDPQDGLILAINNASSPPFGTLIKVDKTMGTLTCGTNILFDKAHGVDATNGAEQPVWDPGTKKFYLSIPEISGTVPGTNEIGAVLRISKTGIVEAQYPIKFCGPAGLALGPQEDLLVGCNTIFDTGGNKWTTNADRRTLTAAPQLVILDAKTGGITANIRGAGVGDEVWFNKGDNHYYAAASGSNLAPNAITPARSPVGTATTAPVLTAQGAATLDVIDALSETLDQRVPTLNVPAVTAAGEIAHPAGTAHSVAADQFTNNVFVPIAANNAVPNCLTGCITIYARSDPDSASD